MQRIRLKYTSPTKGFGIEIKGGVFFEVAILAILDFTNSKTQI